MAKHEFGIMLQDPAPGIRFDRYEPGKYSCVAADDAFIEPILADLVNLDCYWHTLDMPQKGLSYCGITLIPPASMDAFLAVISENAALSDLKALLMEAKAKKHFVIHFGI